MKTVLLIEPAKANRALVEVLFSQTDVRVLAAATLRDGIDIALREFPNLIMTEFVIPDRGGPCAIEALHRHEDLSSIPVIVWAAEGIGDVKARTEVEGGRFLPKNTPPRVLVQSVLNVLHEGERRRALRGDGDAPLRRRRSPRSDVVPSRVRLAPFHPPYSRDRPGLS